MKQWGIVMMLVGIVVLVGNALFVGIHLLNFLGAALILFPVVLYLVRLAESSWKRTAR